MIDSLTGKMAAPSIPHRHLFTFNQCFAQVEAGSRVHYFALLPEEHELALFFYRRGEEESDWRRMELPAPEGRRILEIFTETRIPLWYEVKFRTTAHLNHSIEIKYPGTTITVWWDANSEVVEAMKPLLDAIKPLVERVRGALGPKPRQMYPPLAPPRAKQEE